MNTYTIRVTRRDKKGRTMDIFNIEGDAATKNEARKLARADCIGRAWLKEGA